MPDPGARDSTIPCGTSPAPDDDTAHPSNFEGQGSGTGEVSPRRARIDSSFRALLLPYWTRWTHFYAATTHPRRHMAAKRLEKRAKKTAKMRAHGYEPE